MQTAKSVHWMAGITAVGLTAAAAIAAYPTNRFAHAQPSISTNLTPNQLNRLQRMQGEFSYQSGPSRPELWKSVEASTTKLDPVQAQRTRAKLEQLLTPPPRVVFALDMATAAPIFAIEEGRAGASAPLTGEPRTIRPKGAAAEAQALQLSQQLQGKALVRVVEGRGFRQERRFTLQVDGSLTLEIRVTGPVLAGMLSSSASYRRL